MSELRPKSLYYLFKNIIILMLSSIRKEPLISDDYDGTKRWYLNGNVYRAVDYSGNNIYYYFDGQQYKVQKDWFAEILKDSLR